MPFVLKVYNDVELPTQGSFAVPKPSRAYTEKPEVGEKVFVFVDDTRARDGGLRARGKILEATHVEANFWNLVLNLSEDRPMVPLPNFALAPFQKTKSSQIEHSFEFMEKIAELRRQTTHQPLHPIPRKAADWIDWFHFQKGSE